KQSAWLDRARERRPQAGSRDARGAADAGGEASRGGGASGGGGGRVGDGPGMMIGWLAKYREGGPQALRARPVPGKPPKLNGAQLRRLYTLIVGADLRQLRFG